jgi:ribosomal protein S21
MLKVEIKSGESIDQALKRLKYKVIKSKQNQIMYEKKDYCKLSNASLIRVNPFCMSSRLAA